MSEPETTAQDARALRARNPDGPSVLELEIPQSAAAGSLVVTAVVPIPAGQRSAAVPGFQLAGVEADVVPLARDAQGRATTVVVAAPFAVEKLVPGSFHRIPFQPTGEPARAGAGREIEPLDLEVVVRCRDGVFTARPFSDGERGEKTLGRFRSTWRSWALLEGRGGETRGIVIASLELRSDGFAVLELLLANALQRFEESSALGGDFTYREVEVRTSSTIVLPLPRFGEKVLAERGVNVARLVGDGATHLWPRMLGALRRFVLAPPRLSKPLRDRAVEIGRWFGTAFAVEGPNSWADAGAHGPELGLLAPWIDEGLDLWGQAKGQAAARNLLASAAGALEEARTKGLAKGPFLCTPRGLFHPLGQFQEGEPGGWKIRPCGSFALDRRLLLERWLEIEHGLDRSRVLHFQPRAGRPTSAAAWARAFGGRVPFAWKNHGEERFPWMRFRRSPATGEILLESNVYQGRLDEHADGILLRYHDQDDQHEIRDVEPVETVVRFSGSGIGLSLLEVLGENGMLARHEFQSPAGDVTLSKLLQELGKRSGRGSTNAGRGLAWDLRAIAAWWEVAPDSWRKGRGPWAAGLATWARGARAANGLLGNDPDNGHVSRVAIEQGAPAGFRYVQTFEEAYLALSLEQLATVAIRGNVPERVWTRLLADLVDGIGELWSVRDPANGLVPKFVAVGRTGGDELEGLTRSAVSPGEEGTWIWGALACASRSAAKAGLVSFAGAFRDRLLEAGVAPEAVPQVTPQAFRDYVARAQAKERESWHGSVDYSLLAWGEAWSASRGRSPSTIRIGRDEATT